MHTRLGQAVLASWLMSAAFTAHAASHRPNFVFILTDDQDNHMNTLGHMPWLQKYLVDEGTTFERHYCTVAICCPSRVNLWTGQLAHNTNVTNVNLPWGGYPKFVQNGYNEAHLALWMQQSGYNTYYVGKLFNAHAVSNYNSPLVNGYTESNFFLDPFTYQYYNVTTTKNGQPPTNPVGKYSTDIVAESAVEFLDHALKKPESPFFITLAPIAPHMTVNASAGLAFDPPEVAERHRGLLPDYKIPRTDNFNPDSPSGVNWVAKLPKLNDTVIAYNDEQQRLRLRALQAVDEIVRDVVHRLDQAGVLNNTYIFYTSDNGYHISQHRMHPGKTCGYETDINVPLIVRGPGIPKQSVTRVPSSHTDIAPTILQLAGECIEDKKFDGAPIDLFGTSDETRSEHVAVEFWGNGMAETKFGREHGSPSYPNNTYKGLRIEAEEYGFYYSVWCNNEKELYDMKADPGQLNNLLSSKHNSTDQTFIFSSGEKSLEPVVDRLDALMMVLKSCKETSCIYPWRSLHPEGDVESLEDALDPEYDEFYREQVKVSFAKCELGYILSSEGPQSFHVYEDDEDKDGHGLLLGGADYDWSVWE